jgi:hypothetical protein
MGDQSAASSDNRRWQRFRGDAGHSQRVIGWDADEDARSPQLAHMWARGLLDRPGPSAADTDQDGRHSVNSE